MNFYESHFWYNKRQRNGILILTGIVLSLQIFLYCSEGLLTPGENASDPEQLERLNAELDAMIRMKSKQERNTVYPFNPNYMTDFKGYMLGMKPDEIDRLLRFREEGGFLKSAKDFQEVTAVSDSLLEKISAYFRFPGTPMTHSASQTSSDRASSEKTGTEKISTGLKEQGRDHERIFKMDLNKASAQDLQKVHGIGDVLSKRIVAYGKYLQGYSVKEQIFEVYNLPEETAELIFEYFEIREKPLISKLNINKASFKEILSVPYIDYDLTRRITEFRQRENGITDLADLKKIDSFPLDKFERIALYLLAE